MRQHHALRLAGRARGVDDRRELIRARRRAPCRGTRGRAPLPRHPRVAALARPSSSDDDRRAVARPPPRPSRRPLRAPAAGGGPPGSSRAAAASRRSRRRAPESFEDVADLRGGQRRIDRHGDGAAGEDRQIRHQPLGPALGDDRDAIACRHAQRAERPSERSRIRSNNSLLDSHRSRPPAAADEHRLRKPPHHVKRQVGDGVDVDVGLVSRREARQ